MLTYRKAAASTRCIAEPALDMDKVNCSSRSPSELARMTVPLCCEKEPRANFTRKKPLALVKGFALLYALGRRGGEAEPKMKLTCVSVSEPLAQLKEDIEPGSRHRTQATIVDSTNNSRQVSTPPNPLPYSKSTAPQHSAFLLITSPPPSLHASPGYLDRWFYHRAEDCRCWRDTIDREHFCV